MGAKSSDVPKPGKSPEPEPEAGPPPPESPPEPDYVSLVERQLRVADGARDAEKMWAPILRSFQSYQQLLKYVRG